MVIHQREIGYGENYAEFFEALVKAKTYMEKKYPGIKIVLMYSLAGPRGRATIQTHYASLADYERIDAEADQDEAYAKLLEPIMSPAAHPIVDQFYRTIQA
jgi:hypothetical protein